MPPDDTSPSGNGRTKKAGGGSGDAFDDILDDLVNNADSGDSGAVAAKKEPGRDIRNASADGNTGGAEAGPPKESARALTKVELDIDDAPFLEDEEEKQPKPEARPERLPPPKENTRAEEPAGIRKILHSLLRDKKRLASAVAVVLVVLLSPLAYLLFSGKKAPEPAPVAQPAPARPQLPPPPKPTQRYVFEGGPYLVEHRGSEGELRFLRLRITIATDSEQLFHELQSKNITLRDAVYYYLKNKPLAFFNDKQQIDLLRTDLISVINDHVTADKITELYFEEFLITGK